MIGTLVNAAAVILGGSIGLLLKTRLPKRFSTLFFQSVGLFTLAIGVSMVWNMQNMLFIIVSLVLGTLLGTVLKLEENTHQLGEWLKKKLKKGGAQFSEGLTTSFLLFSIGAMSTLGAIEEGTGAYPELLFTKSFMDGIAAIILAAVFGYGVLFSAFLIILFQGGITLLAIFFGDFINAEILNGITVVGGILLLGLGLKILDIKKLPIMNMLPAIVLIALGLWIKTNYF